MILLDCFFSSIEIYISIWLRYILIYYREGTYLFNERSLLSVLPMATCVQKLKIIGLTIIFCNSKLQFWMMHDYVGGKPLKYVLTC